MTLFTYDISAQLLAQQRKIESKLHHWIASGLETNMISILYIFAVILILWTDSVWIRILPPPFLPSFNTLTISPFSLITEFVEMTYHNGKSFFERNRSKSNARRVMLADAQKAWTVEHNMTLSFLCSAQQSTVV